jgi:hypothetical protein
MNSSVDSEQAPANECGVGKGNTQHSCSGTPHFRTKRQEISRRGMVYKSMAARKSFPNINRGIWKRPHEGSPGMNGARYWEDANAGSVG